MPTVIVENDESQWNDATGSLYHFPRRYLTILHPGERVVYYKGRIRDRVYESKRLSPDPHYFGTATIGRVFPDPESAKGDHFATIENYQLFSFAVPARDSTGDYLEKIPSGRETNYWRDGVRAIGEDVYRKIVDQAGVTDSPGQRENWPTNELQSGIEGNPRTVFSTVYERDPDLRRRALEIHGYTCTCCEFNFEERYGEHGKNFIHVHHVKPLNTYGGARKVDPASDLVPVCPNCHSMIHRRKNHTLSIEELRAIYRAK
jgi:putative restriction endonuclease